MPQIKCSELTETSCDFVAEGATAEEAKENFYKHGGESPLHKEAHATATEEQKAAFGQKVDEYLAK